MKHKPLNKEVEEDTRKRKDIPCSWIGRINVMKNDHFTKRYLQIQSHPNKIPISFFTETEKYVKIHIESQKTPR